MVEKIGGVKLKRKYDLDAPKGVAGRNSDNTFIKQVLGWEPNTPLEDGLAQDLQMDRAAVSTTARPARRVSSNDRRRMPTSMRPIKRPSLDYGRSSAESRTAWRWPAAGSISRSSRSTIPPAGLDGGGVAWSPTSASWTGPALAPAPAKLH